MDLKRVIVDMNERVTEPQTKSVPPTTCEYINFLDCIMRLVLDTGLNLFAISLLRVVLIVAKLCPRPDLA